MKYSGVAWKSKSFSTHKHSSYSSFVYYMKQERQTVIWVGWVGWLTASGSYSGRGLGLFFCFAHGKGGEGHSIVLVDPAANSE